MPFINSKVSVKVTPEQEKSLRPDSDRQYLSSPERANSGS
jgi:hypothetical protein